MTPGTSLRRLTGTVVAAGFGLLALAATPALGAPQADDALPVTVQITNVSPAVLTPGEDLGVDVTLRNDGAEPVANPRAALLISRFRLASRPELTAWAAGGVDGAGTVVASVRSDDALDPGASVALHLTLAGDRVGLLDTPDAWGPRGIAVEATGSTGVLGIQRTFLLWQPDGADALWQPGGPEQAADLAVVVPVTGPGTTPASTGGPAPAGGAPAAPTVDPATATALQSLTGTGGRLADLLAVLTDPGAAAVSAAVDPRLVTQARAAGGAAATWSAELDATLAGRDVATLPWADVDAAATAHADDAELTRAAIDRAKAATLSGHRVGSLLWAPTAPDRRTAALVPRLDLTGLVAPPGALAASLAARGATAPVKAAATGSGDARLLVPDATLTTLFTDPAQVEPGSTTSTACQRLLAELAVLARRAPDQSTALAAPTRDWDPDPALVQAELAAVAAAPWARLVGLSGLPVLQGAPSTSLPRSRVSADELDATDVQRLAAARRDALAFSGVTSNPDDVLRVADDALLAPLAVAWRADPAGRSQLVNAALGAVTASTIGLSIAPLSDLNVISATSEVRVTVRNALDVDATVHLVVSPRKACLQAVDPDPLSIPAHGETGVAVTLHATANCEVTVLARLTSPAGLEVAPPVQFTARVAPTIESVGTIVVGVLLAIGLVLGIARTIRRGQSARRGARDEAEAARQDAPLALAPLGGVGAADGPDVAAADRTEREPDGE